MKKSLIAFFDKLSNTGVDKEEDFQIYKRVMLSNYFAMTIIVATSIFTLLYIARGNPLPVALAGLGCIGFLIFLLNHFNFTGFSRFVISIAPGLALLALNINIKLNTPEVIESFHYTSIRLLIAVTVLLPLTVFSTKEIWKMAIAALVLGCVALGVDPICEYFGVGSEQLGIVSIYKKSAVDDVTVVFIVIISSYTFLTRLNTQFQRMNNELLVEAKKQNETLNTREVELKQTLEEVEIARKEEAKRNWATKGLAELNTLLRSTDDPEKMYQALLKGVVKYLDVNQGGLYICEEKEGKTQIELKSCYAYNRQKFIEKVIMPGEGLIGQSYLEGKPVYLKKIPKEYVSITSGLGKATPKNVLIMPLKMRDKVEGIIEIASFKELEKHEINFLESVGEDIASTIGAAKINAKTKHLLDQSRLMSDELMEKEHEMRQNVEELRATQEAMARKEQEYLERIALLEQGQSTTEAR
ncbi:GAF domain-containing protein [Flammeovirgaceae bacterium SG7u.111]|nr:GAF domain-containing protein [Flammeovirgaceae bacterium SG7u.132]WPO36572.1 GAF domain-containing protein [Flammeovirgaceae bacterium SG7u.111]